MRRPVCLALLLTLGTALPETARAQAFPINTDVALQPAEDQWIYRTQFRWRSMRLDATDPDTDIDALINSHVLVYGWTSRLSTVLAVPLIHRDIDGPTTDSDDFGVGDIRAIVRYKLWQKLGFLESQSWTALAGIEIPSYDSPFSSRSWDPIVGTVYSWRRDRHGLDADVVYQINTENDRDFEAGDQLRYDLAYQWRLWPRELQSATRWTLTGLLELNGEYQRESERDGHSLGGTDSHQVFVGPGLVLAGKRSRFELGVQLPLYQDIGSNVSEDDFRAVFGITWTF